ncbi:MAG: hypothetical protein ABEI06_08575 [Halobacteriaceae archaeon]
MTVQLWVAFYCKRDTFLRREVVPVFEDITDAELQRTPVIVPVEGVEIVPDEAVEVVAVRLGAPISRRRRFLRHRRVVAMVFVELGEERPARLTVFRASCWQAAFPIMGA